MKRIPLFVLLLSSSPAVFAQYSGTVSDLNAIFEPPMNIVGIVCDSTLSNQLPHAYKACSDGVAASRWMAEKHAKAAGAYLGCLDGYYQGIWDGYSNAINPTQAMIEASTRFVSQTTFKTAESRALTKAESEGQTVSADQIIKRYRSVIGLRDSNGRPVKPDKTFEYPVINFAGFNDGYEHDVTGFAGEMRVDFNPVYQAGWVRSNDSFENRLMARRAFELQRSNGSQLCNPNQTMFGRRSMPQLTIWDYLKAKRQYNFQQYGWKNPDWAWEIFDKDERTLEQYQTFSRLRTLEKTVTESVPVYEERLKLDESGNPIRKLDANGNPILNAQGRPTFEMERIMTGSNLVTRNVKLSAQEIKELEDLYKNGFRVAYERYYARQYSSINYHTEGISKYQTATLIGKMIGEDVARHLAMRSAYNQQYKVSSVRAYSAAVKTRYENSFKRLIDIFEKNPVLELNEAVISGQVDDSIFRPGEHVFADFSATNLGEVSRPSFLMLNNSIDVIAAQNGFQFSVPALSQGSFRSGAIGQISNDQSARNSINLEMSISNPGNLHEVAMSLVAKKNQRVLLNDYNEIKKVSSEVDLLDGSVSALVSLENPSSIVSPFISDVSLSITGVGQVASVSVEPISAKTTRDISLSAQGLDPLSLINTSSMSGRVAVKLGNRTAHSASVTLSVPGTKYQKLSKYFDALVTGVTKNSGDQSVNDRVASLMRMIEDETENSVRDMIIWRNANEFDQTIISELIKTYNESKRARRLSDEAQAMYQELGEILAPMVKGLRSRGLFNNGRNQKEYLKKISIFAPRINKNPRKY